jgi:hypothetical protein
VCTWYSMGHSRQDAVTIPGGGCGECIMGAYDTEVQNCRKKSVNDVQLIGKLSGVRTPASPASTRRSRALCALLRMVILFSTSRVRKRQPITTATH